MSDDRPWDNDYEESDEEPWKRDHDAWKSGDTGNGPEFTSDLPFSFSRLGDAPPVWNEDKWELFIQQMDKSGRHVIAYYEKFWNFSDRDRMVEEAMALYCIREAFREIFGRSQKNSYVRYFLRPELLDMGLNAIDYQDFFHAKEKSLAKMPAFRMNRDFYRQAKYWYLGLPGGLRSDSVKNGLLHHALTACTKIAGGHIFGYQPFTIGGNIALCKTALRQSHRSGECLKSLHDSGILADSHHDYLTRSHHDAKNATALRVVELRNTLRQHLL